VGADVGVEGRAGSVVVAFTGSTVAGWVCWPNAEPVKLTAMTTKLINGSKRIVVSPLGFDRT
jgi:hypothetical protein